jgi:hypothetical protein
MLGWRSWVLLFLYIAAGLSGCGQDDRIRTSKHTPQNSNPDTVPDNPPTKPKTFGEFDEEEILHLPVKSQPGEFCPRPDGRAVAIVLHSMSGDAIFVNGIKGERFDWIQNLLYSPDSKHLVYQASNGGTYSADRKDYSGGRHFIVYDEKVISADFDEATQPLFSPDGLKLAYLAGKNHKCFVVVDGKPQPGAYAALREAVFSSDSKRLAYPAQLENGKWVVVVDDQPGPEFDDVGQPSFSPNSKRLVYAARKGSKWSAVADQKWGAEFDGVRQPRFANDNQRMGFLANLGGMVGETGKFEGGKWFLMLGETRDKRNFDDARSLTFSPQGFPAFAATSGQGWQVFVGDDESPKFDHWFDQPIVFSAQGLPAYTAAKDGRLYMAAGMKIWIDVEANARPMGPVWSPDGSKVRFIAYYPNVNKFFRQVLEQN